MMSKSFAIGREVARLKEAAIATALLMAAATPAHATLLNFDFSFTGTSPYSGTVTGEIDGLANNVASQPASAVIIDTSSIPVPFSLPFNTIATQGINEFTVTNDQITSLTYTADASIPAMSYLLVLEDFGYDVLINASGEEVGAPNGIAGLTFTLVPEPASSSILGVALVIWIWLMTRTAVRGRTKGPLKDPAGAS